MAEDQRFAGGRPDVLTYRSPDLTDDLTVVGPIPVDLSVSTTGTDADFVVKIIDVYPSTDGGPTQRRNPRPRRRDAGSLRSSLSKPEPLTPGVVTPVHFALPDICHTFRKGHRIAVQIQSSWFPIVDRNPQTFVDIYRASEGDFRKAEVTVWRGGEGGSKVVLGSLTPRPPSQPVAGSFSGRGSRCSVKVDDASNERTATPPSQRRSLRLVGKGAGGLGIREYGLFAIPSRITPRINFRSAPSITMRGARTHSAPQTALLNREFDVLHEFDRDVEVQQRHVPAIDRPRFFHFPAAARS